VIPIRAGWVSVNHPGDSEIRPITAPETATLSGLRSFRNIAYLTQQLNLLR
jgi:hypothetical protein